MRHSKSNLRPVRGITANTVRALLGLRHAGRDCAYLPLERTRLVDQVKGSVPPPCIDPRDVPATLRDDCDSYPSVPAEVARSFASKTIQATNGINGRKGRVIIDEFFDTPYVAQPAPSAECSDEARSAGPTEPTAPTTPAPIDRACQKRPDGPTIEDQAYAAAVAKERRAGRAADRIERDRTDQGGRSGHAAGADCQAGRVSRPARSGTAARAAGEDGVGEVPQPELKRSRIDTIREIAAKLDQRNAPAPRPIAAPRIERKPLSTLGPDPLAQRREEIARAIRFLKSRCVLVDITDRNAPIRKYRVSGKREAMLAEQVIEHAIALGMEPAHP